MAKIVAFSVPSMEDGERALDELESITDVMDVALVYKTPKGKVKIRQTSDATTGKGMLTGGLLGGVASIFVGPFVGMAVAGAATGGLYGALRDKGVSDKLMKLAGKQLEEGGAAVFVLATDGTADRIVEGIEEVAGDGYTLEVGEFPQEAQALVREALKLES